VQQRYAGWNGELGSAIAAGQRSLSDLSDYIVRESVEPRPRSGRQEMLENLLNRYRD
jgi:xylose isomerase